MIRFIIILLITAGLLAAFVNYGSGLGYFQRPSFYLVSLGFLAFSTLLIFFYLYTSDKPGFFVQLYLLTMVVKILAYLAFCYIMISRDKASAAGNVVFFMCTYFVFTAIEIGFLYPKISRQKPS